MQDLLLRRLPELRGLPLTEQRQLWDEASRKYLRGKRLLALIVAVPICALTAAIAKRLLSSSSLSSGLGDESMGVVASATCLILLFTFIGYGNYRYVRRQLWRMLPHLCPACGYDLTGNESGVCPECGRATRPGATA